MFLLLYSTRFLSYLKAPPHWFFSLKIYTVCQSSRKRRRITFIAHVSATTSYTFSETQSRSWCCCRLSLLFVHKCFVLPLGWRCSREQQKTQHYCTMFWWIISVYRRVLMQFKSVDSERGLTWLEAVAKVKSTIKWCFQGTTKSTTHSGTSLHQQLVSSLRKRLSSKMLARDSKTKALLCNKLHKILSYATVWTWYSAT